MSERRDGADCCEEDQQNGKKVARGGARRHLKKKKKQEIFENFICGLIYCSSKTLVLEKTNSEFTSFKENRTKKNSENEKKHC